MELDWLYWGGTALAAAFILIGLLGALIPVLPGTPLIFVGALIYGYVTDFAEINLTVLISLGVMALVSQGLGYLASSIGAKKFGSSKWGVLGAVLGSILGVFMGGPIGLAIFPFLFAFLLELLAAGKTVKKSLRTAFGSMLGVLGGIVMQFVFGLVMVVTLLVAVL
ncbi:MAG: DUF456 domain-containing protein [Parcubacteria group bacterium]